MAYIPDKVRVLIHERVNRIEVYSADEGHEHEPALAVSAVTIGFTPGMGIDARIAFRTNAKLLNSNTVSAEYTLDATSFVVAPRFDADVPEGMRLVPEV